MILKPCLHSSYYVEISQISWNKIQLFSLYLLKQIRYSCSVPYLSTSFYVSVNNMILFFCDRHLCNKTCENSIGSFEKCIFLINYFKNPSWNHDKHSMIVSIEVKLSPDVSLLFRLGVSHQHTPEKWQLLLLQVVESPGRWDLLSLGPFGGCGSSTF